MKAEDPPARDLLAEAQALAGVNPRYALLVTVARARLKRVASNRKSVYALADFVARTVETELNRAEIFTHDMQRSATSAAARAGRSHRLQSAFAVNLPNETDEQRIVRIGVAYAGARIEIPIHRAGSALWEAIKEKKGLKRPRYATNAEMFAVLGLIFAVEGMSWRPAIYGQKGVKSLFDKGEPAVRSALDGFAQASQNLLYAAECIYGWMHLKPESKPRAEWKKSFKKMMPTFRRIDGSYIEAIDALAAFLKAHPEFADDVPGIFSFGVDYSRMKDRLSAKN